MKQLIIILGFIFSFCSLTFAQSLSFELDKIRQIKLIESTRDDVKRILSGYKSDVENDDDPGNSETFSSEKIDVEISYTTGDCSGDEDYADEWNVAKGKIKLVKISFNDPVKFKNLQFDISNFQKEQIYVNVEDIFFYHNKELGIAIKVDKERIEEILLFPMKKQSKFLCRNEEAEDLKKMYVSESFFFIPKLEDRILEVPAPSRVADITLSTSAIKVSCSAIGSNQNKNCSNSPRIIFVSSISNDPENDKHVVFNYTVSGGRIVGTGKDVMWDLGDVKPGKYTITAGVDDGCGICGPTVTKTVVVKECPDCR